MSIPRRNIVSGIYTMQNMNLHFILWNVACKLLCNIHILQSNIFVSSHYASLEISNRYIIYKWSLIISEEKVKKVDLYKLVNRINVISHLWLKMIMKYVIQI